MFCFILQNTGSGKNQSIQEVNPLALFETSSITGKAVNGSVNPNMVNIVLCILKLAFPVTATIKV